VALNPNFYNSHFNLGVVLEQLQDAAGAREQFKKAIELGANEPEVRFELARFCARWRNRRGAGTTQLYQQRLKEESDKSLAILKSTQAEEASRPETIAKLPICFAKPAPRSWQPRACQPARRRSGRTGRYRGRANRVAAGHRGRSGICPRTIPAWLSGNPRGRQCRG